MLFLVYDRYTQNNEYDKIKHIAMGIIFQRFPDSPLFNLLEREKLQYLDILKNPKGDNQTKTEIVWLLKRYLSQISEYLEADAFLELEEI